MGGRAAVLETDLDDEEEYEIEYMVDRDGDDEARVAARAAPAVRQAHGRHGPCSLRIEATLPPARR
jgi:hypothetical protein